MGCRRRFSSLPHLERVLCDQSESAEQMSARGLPVQATTRSHLCGLISVPQLEEFKFVHIHFLLQLLGRGLVQLQLAIDFELLLLQSLRKYEMPACFKIVAESLSLDLKQRRAERRKQHTPSRTPQHTSISVHFALSSSSSCLFLFSRSWLVLFSQQGQRSAVLAFLTPPGQRKASLTAGAGHCLSA